MLAANTKVTGLGFTPAYPAKHDPKVSDNNCLIFAVCGDSVDSVEIRKQLTKLVGDQIQKHLVSSSKEEKITILHYLNLCYDLGMNRTINDYMESNSSVSKLKQLERDVIKSTEERINKGDVLDLVFAGQALANLTKNDIVVSSKLGNSLVEHHLRSESNLGNSQPVMVQLDDEHFTGAVPACLSLNRVTLKSVSSFSAADQVNILSTIDFIKFSGGMAPQSPEISAKYQPLKAVDADVNRGQLSRLRELGVTEQYRYKV